MSRIERFEIYQVNREFFHDIFGMSYEFLRDRNLSPHSTEYNLVWTEYAPPPKLDLEAIYTRFNVDRPEDFRGHSLSMTDVVVLVYDCGVRTAHMVDQIGFTTIPDFFEPAPTVRVQDDTTGFRARGYRGTWRAIIHMPAFKKDFYLMEEENEPVYNRYLIVDERGTILATVKDKEFNPEMMAALFQEALDVPVLPDQTISRREMQVYGYTTPGVLPMRAAAARKHLGAKVYCLNEDGSSYIPADKATLEKHAEKGGLFGVWKGDWLGYLRDAEGQV